MILDQISEIRSSWKISRLKNRPEWQSAERTTNEFISRSTGSRVSFNNRWSLLENALRMAPARGDFLEFGVFRGSSLRFIAGAVGPEARVFGFDSFWGLPEAWVTGGGVVPSGTFRIARPPNPPSNAILIQGGFERTIPTFVSEVRPSPVFLHIDSDLYSSARTVLTGIGPLLGPGTVLVFDEFFGFPGWERGEARALEESTKEFGWDVRLFGFANDKVGLILE
jgi:hypothetical protein